MDRNAKIYVAGHRGLAGSAIVRKLRAEGYGNLLLRTSEEVDLRDSRAVAELFASENPDYVFVAAAKVGGIVANSTYPADFIYDNLMIETNIIHESWRSGVKRLLFLGSTCIYPKMAPQPLKEEYLLTGPLEPTNDAYAVAKIAGITLCRSYNRQHWTKFLSAMPTNLYGPGDNFDLQNSHVLPALIRKFHEAKIEGRSEVVVWGTGTPFREFLHVDDLADACLYLVSLPDNAYEAILADENAPGLINVGSGEEVSIRDLAILVKKATGFEGQIVFDTSKPDGTPRKMSDTARLRKQGWEHKVPLAEGLAQVYSWFCSNRENGSVKTSA